MIKEKNLAVKEVDVVLEVLMEYYNKKESMPYDVLEKVIKNIITIKQDYDKTINELLSSNSLISKYEKLMELVGAVGTISVEDEEFLDKSLRLMSNLVKSK
ncbi:MAG: hypothetical protein J6D28_01200 [Bacilli bacterium]|nr:hypothetical protein [Bacilli bacterium]